MLQFKNLEKQKQTKTKSNMWQKVIKIRAGINEIGSRKIQSKRWLFKK